MAAIFISYRRTDGAQAARMHDWLVSRFGSDAVFMDVEDIPFAVSFPDFLREAIEASSVVLALIGPGWADRLGDEADFVRRELEWAVERSVPLLPVLIGTTPMPRPDDLPATLSYLASLNARTVDVLQGFHAHMAALLGEIEGHLGSVATSSVVTESPDVMSVVAAGINHFLWEQSSLRPWPTGQPEFQVLSARELGDYRMHFGCSLIVHRVSRVADFLDLHVLVSVSAPNAASETDLAGWVLREFERTPIIPAEAFYHALPGCEVRIRHSEEDPREIWKLVANAPLALSLGYVATVAPRRQPPVTEGGEVAGAEGGD